MAIISHQLMRVQATTIGFYFIGLLLVVINMDYSSIAVQLVALFMNPIRTILRTTAAVPFRPRMNAFLNSAAKKYFSGKQVRWRTLVPRLAQVVD